VEERTPRVDVDVSKKPPTPGTTGIFCPPTIGGNILASRPENGDFAPQEFDHASTFFHPKAGCLICFLKSWHFYSFGKSWGAPRDFSSTFFIFIFLPFSHTVDPLSHLPHPITLSLSLSLSTFTSLSTSSCNSFYFIDAR
jgi:hypothetical protein